MHPYQQGDEHRDEKTKIKDQKVNEVGRGAAPERRGLERGGGIHGGSIQQKPTQVQEAIGEARWRGYALGMLDTTTSAPGDMVHQNEIWWCMVLDAHNPTHAQLRERYYLSDPGEMGCRKILDDVQRGPFLAMLALNLDQMDDTLGRFDTLRALGGVIDLGEGDEEAWLVWMGQGGTNPVQEVWTYTKDPQQAEKAAEGQVPGGSPLLRVSLSTLQNARKTLMDVLQGQWEPVWLDLRKPPRHLSPGQLLERKQASREQRAG